VRNANSELEFLRFSEKKVRNAPQACWYSVYLPQEDGRLSYDVLCALNVDSLETRMREMCGRVSSWQLLRSVNHCFYSTGACAYGTTCMSVRLSSLTLYVVANRYVVGS